jgi:hypothetical protein
MPSEFNPTVFLPGDRAGQGRWEVGHYRQHIKYVTHLAGLATPILIADHPLMTIGENDLQRRLWLEDHQATHEILRTYADVTGIDLSAVDFDDPHEVTIWLDTHATEHSLIDQAFGL